MDIDDTTSIQKKRRNDFKANANKVLKKYTTKSLTKCKEEISENGYEEWCDDYHAMISQGKKVKSLNINEFRVFVQAVYGWMPVLYSQKNIKILKKNLFSILSGKKFSRETIYDAAYSFSSNKHSAGSISALSKLLHFCSPEEYSVWDTRVARALGRKSGTGNSVDVYLDYLSVMSDLKSDKRLADYYKYYKKVIDPRATRVRALEHGLYFKGKRQA